MQWLVSVRSEAELLVAARYAVDIVDFKEPRHGPLSPADPVLWESASGIFRDRATVTRAVESVSQANFPPPLLSAALGEGDEMRRVADRVPPSFAFAKVGPSGCCSLQLMSELWTDAIQRIPSTVELVAVAYSDYEAAGCLPPEDIFQLAANTGLRRCLLDTFTKKGESTFDVLGRQRLQRLSVLADRLDLWWTLAGSIKLSHLELMSAHGISPNCVGIRGDVCHQDRATTLSEDRLQLWSETIKQQMQS
jgi:uncharacterized protein (UPF0264 family)